VYDLGKVAGKVESLAYNIEATTCFIGTQKCSRYGWASVTINIVPDQ